MIPVSPSHFPRLLLHGWQRKNSCQLRLVRAMALSQGFRRRAVCRVRRRALISCSTHRSPLSYRVRCARNSAPPSLMGSALVSRRSLPGRMLINLLPDFFAVLDSTDRVAAYQRYFEAHRRILEPYWHNYVVDPDGPHFGDVIRATALADRSDLREMLERTDVVALARSTEQRCGR